MGMEELKNKLKKRKCPYCQEDIKIYFFSSMVLPYESQVQTMVDQAEQIKSDFPFTSVFNLSMNTWRRFLLASECQCGHISFWKLDHQTLSALLSDDMENEGYFIKLTYIKQQITDFIEKATDQQLKKNLETLLTQFQSPKNEA